MPAPKHHGCYGDCEKEEFDARNAKVVLPIAKDVGCPNLTPAQITAIEADIESQYKGEIETKKCPGDECKCTYNPAPPWPVNYITINLDWKAEKKVGEKKCQWRFKATVDTASRTVTGKCEMKAGARQSGKTDL